jgi:hypothetical protein
MPKQVTSLRHAAIAAVVAVLLSPPMPSVAQADQRAGRTHAAAVQPHTHTARIHHQKRREAGIRPGIYGAVPNAGRCAWPYQNQFPPCMSTWPAGDPNFHGSTHPGVTFDAPWAPD